tara:strand:- start:594 stop:866 length:273 start_codon:yes stop_codon:yes gene_type:complete
MKNYPKLYYETEKKMIHKVGYTLALGMMGVGVLETAHSIPYTLRGESDLTGKILGPMGIIAGGYMAYLYLNEAGLVGGLYGKGSRLKTNY